MEVGRLPPTVRFGIGAAREHEKFDRCLNTTTGL